MKDNWDLENRYLTSKCVMINNRLIPTAHNQRRERDTTRPTRSVISSGEWLVGSF